jgi:hypothetical protein
VNALVNSLKKILLIAFSIQSFDIASADIKNHCNFNGSEFHHDLGDYRNLQNIEIKIHNYKKWSKNQFGLLISKDANIHGKFKKKFKADIILNFHFGVCNFEGLIRQHGDLKDHIQFGKMGRSITQSLDVEILNGSLLNFTRFKLLLKETRNGHNEILTTHILRQIGYIAPQTFYIDLNVNDVEYTVLLQEKSAKELIEKSNLKDGPIFEGDESLIWSNADHKNFSLESISLSRLTNPNWINSEHNKAIIAIDALNRLQLAYQKYSSDSKNIHALDWSILTGNRVELISRWAQYEILLMSVNGLHALRPHNRKFYYNSMLESFEPIYFDGNTLVEGEYLKDWPDFSYFTHLSSIHFEEIKKKLLNIDTNSMYESLIGTASINSINDVHHLIDGLIKKIDKLHDFFLLGEDQNFGNSVPENNTINTNYNIKFQERVNKVYPDAKYITLGAKPDNKFLRSNSCTFTNKQCISNDLSPDELTKLFKNQYKRTKLGSIFFIPNPIIASRNKEEGKIGSIKYRHSIDNLQLNIDEQAKEILIEFFEPSAWILFYDSIISDYSIRVIGKDLYEGSLVTPLNIFGVSGCLNFLNSKFQDTNIFVNVENSSCEDALNIVNSEGSINNIFIDNASSDALDIDFSSIKINNLEVINALNDCADFSYGNYKINKLLVRFCGDKGVSVGERSDFRVTNASISDSLTGLASKDSSLVNILDFRALRTETCIDGFQKKIEFSGSMTRVDQFFCPDGSIRSDYQSTIIINNEL